MSLQVEFISRRGCHLCDEAKAVLTRLCDERALRFAERDVDADPELFLYYTHRVPVLLLNGKPVTKLRWDEDAVRQKLPPSPGP